MSEKTDKLLFKFARRRVEVSRFFAVLIIFLVIFTSSSFNEGGWIDLLFESIGLFLLSICSAGRLWTLLYISGKKSHEIITEGPYSVMRHPLYLFSFIGAFGLGLASENLLVLAVIVAFYLLYYPLTILSEEHTLISKFGQTYIDYAKKTPRFIPKSSLYKSPEYLTIDARYFVHSMHSGLWFIWAFILFNFIEMLQKMGMVPILLKFP